MTLWKRLARYRSRSAVLICLTLATGAAFKGSAFVREAFIAAKFGISAVTDAYFGLQQFPTTLATFMFGAFALAFTPAYAEARGRSGKVEWLPGLVFYGCLVGTALTALMLACSPFLLHIFHSAGARDVQSTLAILSVCYVPIICIGMWTGICTARGHNLWAMSVSGLPYLVMTLTLFSLYGMRRLNNLSLPVSLTTGFGLVGLYSLICILRSQSFPKQAKAVISVWKFAEFRKFLRQLGASSLENGGFAGNQLLMLYFLSQAETGVLSANNFAMRIGMLGYSLLAQPLALLVQARLCAAKEQDRPQLFRRWIFLVAGAVLFFAATLLMLRFSVIRVVYMHGKFQGAELGVVAGLLPAWIGYFVIMSINAVVARYLFIRNQGSTYVRRQLGAYVAANLLRLGIGTAGGGVWIIWCSVIAESAALFLNLRTAYTDTSVHELVPTLSPTGEAF